MSQDEFLKILEKSLQGFSTDEKREILYDYEEHFCLGKENGKTNNEIIKELGNPLDIAKHYKSNRVASINENQNNNYRENYNNQNSNNNYTENSNTQRSKKSNPMNDDSFSYSYTPNKLPKILIFLLLTPFVILPSIGIILGLYGSILGLFATSLAVVISGVALSLGGIFGTTILGLQIISFPNISMIPMPALLFAGIGTIALGALFFIGTLCLIKLLNRGTSKYFSLILSLLK
ncbi:HAAS signaling domain-containing protein [Clostridium algidicarnis]|uniref:HAAS signaling domain-containing protein n=1 Tax=Clostridium algidicarnis TaxID=37659 RepID=UPI001C0DBEC7|nr:DUF1700 domain-containing protein [Clostridium algidicarnis]MBU3192836.1 DUF1700 domain-containing protein [Clostridium algidicarnis]